jgi:hypothetical protein
MPRPQQSTRPRRPPSKTSRCLGRAGLPRLRCVGRWGLAGPLWRAWGQREIDWHLRHPSGLRLQQLLQAAQLLGGHAVRRLSLRWIEQGQERSGLLLHVRGSGSGHLLGVRLYLLQSLLEQRLGFVRLAEPHVQARLLIEPQRREAEGPLRLELTKGSDGAS